MGVIYKATNLINGKLYIGQTIDFVSRVTKHKSDARHAFERKDSSYFHKAMHKYGVDNFKFEIIEKIDNSLLNEREKFWIKELNTFAPNGYNLTLGGDAFDGFVRKQTEEEKKKRKETLIKYYENNPELKKERQQKTKKLWENAEYRIKVINGIKNFNKKNPGFFAKENNPFYGHNHTEETKAKLKASSKWFFVEQLDKNTLEVLKTYEGLHEMNRQTGYDRSWISKAAKQNKVAYGYRWKILESVTTNCNSEISTE